MTKEELRKELFNLRLELKFIENKKEQKIIIEKIKEIKKKMSYILFEERKEENDQYQRR